MEAVGDHRCHMEVTWCSHSCRWRQRRQSESEDVVPRKCSVDDFGGSPTLEETSTRQEEGIDATISNREVQKRQEGTLVLPETPHGGFASPPRNYWKTCRYETRNISVRVKIL